MESYYSIDPDYDLTDQWHLAWPRTAGGEEIVSGVMSLGQRWNPEDKLYSSIYSSGRQVNFYRGTSVFFLSARIMNVLRLAVGEVCVQGVPVEIEGVNEPFEILNVLDIVDCLDEGLSGLSWRLDSDGRRHYVVNRLKVDAAKAAGHDLFRVETWPVALVCSKRIRDLLLAGGVTGVTFTPVT